MCIDHCRLDALVTQSFGQSWQADIGRIARRSCEAVSNVMKPQVIYPGILEQSLERYMPEFEKK